MELKLEKTKRNEYVIKNEKDKILYIIKKELPSVVDKYYIFDENQLQLAEIKQNLFGKTKYKLYMNGTVVDEVIISEKVPLKTYYLNNKKWSIKGDITYTNYIVTNNKEEQILEMNCNLAINPDNWQINIIKNNDKIYNIMAIVIILSISRK